MIQRGMPPLLARLLQQRSTLVLFCLFSVACHVRAHARDLEVFWVDVEGGAATLIVTPTGESVLVDTGMPGGRDPGRIVAVATNMAKLKQIDHLVTTHMHIDHFGGAAEVAAALPIGHVHDNGIPDRDPDGNTSNASFPLTIKPYRDMRVERRSVLQPGDQILEKPALGNGKSITLRCIGGKQRFIAAGASKPNPVCSTIETKAPDSSDNANSIVLVLEYGEFRLFIGGDLTWNVESMMACPVNLVGHVSVYQVTHHGMDISNNPVLVRSLAPVVAIMSNGTSKGCGPATIKTLQALPSLKALYQIHQNLREDREANTRPEWIANLEKNCSANPIALRVAPDSKSFTVSIPAKGHSATYPSR